MGSEKSASAETRENFAPLDWLLSIGMALTWGSSFLLIDIAIRDFHTAVVLDRIGDLRQQLREHTHLIRIPNMGLHITSGRPHEINEMIKSLNPFKRHSGTRSIAAIA